MRGGTSGGGGGGSWGVAEVHNPGVPTKVCLLRPLASLHVTCPLLFQPIRSARLRVLY